MRHRDFDIDDDRPPRRRGVHPNLKRDNLREEDDYPPQSKSSEDYPVPNDDYSYLARSIRS